MALSNDLISQFVKVTKDKTRDKSETIVYGTVQKSVAPNGLNYVKIDGSDMLTPISSTTVVSPNDRVTIMIKNHSAVVTGNLTSPAARSSDTIDVSSFSAQTGRIDSLEAIDITVQGLLDAHQAEIDSLEADNVTIKGTLDANTADIGTLKADTATISGKVTANEAAINNLKAGGITADEVAATYATIENLNSEKARIDTLIANGITAEVVESTYATIENLNTEKARIDTLETTKLSAADIEGKYANIDFSNISKATMGEFYANSGLIQNVVVGDSTITGKLVGVTISGDLIEGNTVKAEKLVIKGTDGLYYKLNTDGMTTEAEQTNENSLDGSVIKAKSITATKISVTDLVAFGATIGGFNITDSALYSGVKSDANNTTRGIYLGKDAQAAIGDGASYIKYYKDSEGNYKLDISADSMTLTSGTNVQTQINALTDSIESTSGDLTAYTTATDNKLKDLQGQTTAAKTAADAAQVDANALKTRMTSAETNITQNSEQIALRATKTEVTTAKESAISTAATDATNKADALKPSIAEAKKAGTDAQSDVDALKTRVAATETSITQNADAIALRATKDELSALDTRVTSAESSITILANSIASNVSETTDLGTRMTTIEQTADGLTARIGTAESGITTAQSTADTAKTNAAKAQSTADTAKTNAATAQSTADTAKTNATKAQTTADTAKTNAATAQSTADTAKTNAATAQSTANEAKKTATNFLSFDTTNGVLIGNKISGSWSGTRAQIMSSAFNILDSSGTVLSSYGSTTTIGKTAANNIYIDGNGVYVRKNGKTLVTFDQYGLKIANANDSSGSLGSGTTKPALVIGTPTAYHIEMDNNEIMAKSNATTSSHLFLNMEGGNVSINNNASRALMFQDGALYAKNSSFNSGEYLGIIDALNDSGNTTFGYGGYLKKIGGTNIYGNSISLVSNGNIDVDASWINCRSIAPNDHATYALGVYGEKGWSNIYLGKGDGKTNALHIISGSSTYTLCGVNSSGQYIFGNNAAVMYYQVKNVSETATGNAFKVTSGNNTAANNTSSIWFFGAADATSRYIGSYLTYNRTYSSAANMVVTANGIFGRSTSSSERYKKDIQLADIGELKGLYDLPVKRFKYKDDYIATDDELYNKDLYGFIVEDLENILPCAVQHKIDENGESHSEMWNSNIIVPSLLKLIQDLNNRLKVLEEKEKTNG